MSRFIDSINRYMRARHEERVHRRREKIRARSLRVAARHRAVRIRLEHRQAERELRAAAKASRQSEIARRRELNQAERESRRVLTRKQRQYFAIVFGMVWAVILGWFARQTHIVPLEYMALYWDFLTGAYAALSSILLIREAIADTSERPSVRDTTSVVKQIKRQQAR